MSAANPNVTALTRWDSLTLIPTYQGFATAYLLAHRRRLDAFRREPSISMLRQVDTVSCRLASASI
jgi:hypothetical protein